MSLRCYTEINTKVLINNLKIYKNLIPNNVDIMAVVKADAYGHGDKNIAKQLYNNGICNFAVSNIAEAIHIREAGVEGQILILGYTPIDKAELLIKYDITQALISEDYAYRLAETCLPVKCQFAIDTGMRRIGLNADDPERCEKVIRYFSDKLKLNGLFTHLCVADMPCQDEYTNHQIFLFDDIVSRIRNLNLPYCHYINSAGGLWHNSSTSCFARLGIVLYGLKPDYANILPDGIKPVLSWKSLVSMIKEVKQGDTIGYGRSFTAKRSMIIATIPTGYADGYPRLLSNKGWVLINGKRAPIIGRICMDQFMVDISDIPGVEYESEVVLLGKSGNEELTADDLANQIGTIGYEIVCGISKRVDRVYI